MEYELNYEKPEFQEELNALMVKASVVKVYGWSRAKGQASVLDLIKRHNYAVQSYTTLNFAKLIPNRPTPLQTVP
jgi:hypothetical protein